MILISKLKESSWTIQELTQPFSMRFKCQQQDMFFKTFFGYFFFIFSAFLSCCKNKIKQQTFTNFKELNQSSRKDFHFQGVSSALEKNFSTFQGVQGPAPVL